uniref:Galactose-specific lectin nattectin-like n=1 Tax=Sinocyclocheilus anshuiensis TaxID=1608454 RepID=A0A671SIB4_9TELE
MGVWTVCMSLCLLFALNASGEIHYDNTVSCLNHGGNLASVHNLKEYTFLKLMISSSRSYWIGGYDAEGTWFWSDGSKMNFKLWNPGEPNNQKHVEHCIEMNYGATGFWNDQECTDKVPFVCAISG